jgi:superfamily I DNA/RNA helicase
MIDHPTDEQIDILNAASATGDNLMISALAGCGKSTTLLAIERAVERQPITYLVFNTENAEKIMSFDQMAVEHKRPKAHHSKDPNDRVLPTTTVRTFNSMGHRLWAATQQKRLVIEQKKTYNIFREIAQSAPTEHREAIWSVYGEVSAGVALAKALGYIPEGGYPSAKRLLTQNQFLSMLDEVPDDLTVDLIDTVLHRSIRQSYEGLLDYNDQVYMPALFGGVFPKFPLVLVDEYQDLSPVNHMLLSRLVKGRLIGVGDPWQNIYGFRGASAGGMAQAISRYSCAELPLSISFRCPSEIVKNVHWRVPNFKWINKGGSVERPDLFNVSEFSDSGTVLCRNNAPLLRLAFRLLSSGRRISVAGSDIGPRLIAQLKKLGPETMSKASLMSAIADWEAAKLEKESKSAVDMAACMRIFAEHGENLDQAVRYAEYLFKQEGQLYLSTIHKAKGLEWDTVYYLDPWMVRKNPSEQEKNLDYVASTRSRDRLIEIESDLIQW